MIEVAYVFDEDGPMEYVEQRSMPMVGGMITFNDEWCSESDIRTECIPSEFHGTWVIRSTTYDIDSSGEALGVRAQLMSCEQALEERNKREYYGEEEAGAAADPDDGSTT